MCPEIPAVDIVTHQKFTRFGEVGMGFGVVYECFFAFFHFGTLIYFMDWSPGANGGFSESNGDEFSDGIFLKDEEVAIFCDWCYAV